jgi:hypothetical protein
MNTSDTTLNAILQKLKRQTNHMPFSWRRLFVSQPLELDFSHEKITDIPKCVSSY